MSRNNRIGAALGHVRRRLAPRLQAETAIVRLKRELDGTTGSPPSDAWPSIRWELEMMYLAGFDRGVDEFKHALDLVENGP